jgi:hypothetical protein
LTTLGDIEVQGRTWETENGVRGFLKIGAALRKNENEAVVLRIKVRRREEPALTPTAPIVPKGRLLAELEEAKRVVLLGEAVPQPAIGTTAINVLVRFDPLRPTSPGDEELTMTLNSAISAKQSTTLVATFGKAKPFRLEWALSAENRRTHAAVPIVVGGAAEFVGRPPANKVAVSTFPGPLTEAMTVEAIAPGRELEAREQSEFSLGHLLLWVPKDVIVRGRGRVRYVGSKDLGLSEPALTVSFHYPQWSYADVWDLIQTTLVEVSNSEADASKRLAVLKRDVCAPAPEAECPNGPIAQSVAEKLANPDGYWDTQRELTSGERPYARLVWLFARALMWDERVTNDERELFKKLLVAGVPAVSSAN